MRLIDADALIDTLKSLEMDPDPKSPFSCYSMQESAYKQGIMEALNEIAADIINDEPIVFDTKRVLMDLKGEEVLYECNSKDDYCRGRSEGMKKAIAIVKRGGVKDEKL